MKRAPLSVARDEVIVLWVQEYLKEQVGFPHHAAEFYRNHPTLRHCYMGFPEVEEVMDLLDLWTDYCDGCLIPEVRDQYLQESTFSFFQRSLTQVLNES